MKLGLGLVALGASACGGVEHVSIAPLPPDPTPDQRVWIFNTLQPRSELTETIRRCSRGGGCTTETKTALQLADGAVIRDPEDLAPVVASDSGTLAHAHRARRAEGRLPWWGATAVTSLVVGFVLAMKGHDNGDDTELEVGLGIAVGGLMVGSIGGYIEREHVNDERRAAFAMYPKDLASRLALCASGRMLVPCEQNTPATVAPEPRDPGLDQLRPR